MTGDPPPVDATDNAFWDYWRERLTPCPCGGRLVFTGAQLRATCWVYCMGHPDHTPLAHGCAFGHGFERNHPIAYWDCAASAAPQAARLWNTYLADRGWEHPERNYSDRKPEPSER